MAKAKMSQYQRHPCCTVARKKVGWAVICLRNERIRWIANLGKTWKPE